MKKLTISVIISLLAGGLYEPSCYSSIPSCITHAIKTTKEAIATCVPLKEWGIEAALFNSYSLYQLIKLINSAQKKAAFSFKETVLLSELFMHEKKTTFKTIFSGLAQPFTLRKSSPENDILRGGSFLLSQWISPRRNIIDFILLPAYLYKTGRGIWNLTIEITKQEKRLHRKKDISSRSTSTTEFIEDNDTK